MVKNNKFDIRSGYEKSILKEPSKLAYTALVLSIISLFSVNIFSSMAIIFGIYGLIRSIQYKKNIPLILNVIAILIGFISLIL